LPCSALLLRRRRCEDVARCRAGIRAPRGLAKRARMGAAAADGAAAGAPLALGAAPAAATPDAGGAAMPARGSAPLPLRPPSRLGLAGTPGDPAGVGEELRSQRLPAALHAAARPPAPALAGARARRGAIRQHYRAGRSCLYLQGRAAPHAVRCRGVADRGASKTSTSSATHT